MATSRRASFDANTSVPPFVEGKYSANNKVDSFLQVNEEAFRQLVTFVNFAAEKLTIGFVSVNFPMDRVTIIEALQQHPDCQDIQFSQLEFNDPKLRFLQDELVTKLPKVKREPNKKFVLLLTGLESSIRMVGELNNYPPMLVDLNYVRDGFNTSVPHLIIIFLPDRSLSRLAQFAPDFWAWRRAVISFKSLPDSVMLLLSQVVRYRNFPGLHKEERTSYAALDSRARRDTIPLLLMEYESGVLAQDEEYQAFESELRAELGINLYNENNLDVAKDVLQKSLETDSLLKLAIYRPRIHCCLGSIERQQNNYEKAFELLNQSIAEFQKIEEEKYPDFRENLAEAISNRGATYQLTKNYEKAIADFSWAIELNPRDKWTIAQRGRAYQSVGSYLEAVTDFNRVIELDPKYKWAITLRGVTYLLMKHHSDAVADYSRAIELSPEYKLAITILRGVTYLLMNSYSKAVVDFTCAIELDPQLAEAFFLRGYTYQSTNNSLEADADFTRAIELDPEYAGVIASRHEIYRLIQRYSGTVTDSTHAIELDPECRKFKNRGNLYRSMGRYPEAIADFSRAIELDLEFTEAIASRGYTYRLMGRYPEAIADLTRAIELDPNYAWVIAARGRTYRLMKRYPEAVADFTRAIGLNQKDSWVIAHRGQTYQLMKHYPEAIADLTRAIELYPEYRVAITRRGKVYTLTGNYNQALQDFERSLELEPENDWTLYMRSLTYKALNQTKNAKADITAAIEIACKDYQENSRSYRNTFNIAIYYLTTGDIDQSKRLCQEALSNDFSVSRIREAIRDIEDLLTILPNYPNAEDLRSYLQVNLTDSV